MNQADVDALIKKHHLDGYTLNGAGDVGAEQLADGRWKITLGGLPNLGFFVELAALASIPIEAIVTDTEEHESGCDTCGFGGGTELIAYVPGALS